MEHTFTVIDLGDDAKFRRQICARCNCGFLTDVVQTFTDLDDLQSDHEREARRLALGLGVQRPSLKTTLKHYEKMAGHPALTVPERTAWERLAAEIRDRITTTTVDNTIGQDSLFDLTEE